MITDLPDELLIEGVARAVGRTLMSDAVIERMVDKLFERLSILTPDEMAAFLRVSRRTLGEKHAEWGFTKSVTLGFSEPRYFLGQVLERMGERAVNGQGIRQGKLNGKKGGGGHT